MDNWTRKYHSEPRGKQFLAIGLIIVFVLFLFRMNYYSGDHNQLREQFSLWRSCVSDALGHLDQEQFWNEIGKAANNCQPLLEIADSSRLSGYPNNDEIKYHLLPIDRSSDTVMISLGIGGDIEAEKKLKPHLTDSSIFVGTDPDISNHNTYRQVGMYLPVTVGNQSGNVSVDTIAVNGEYTTWNTFMITLPQLIKEYLPKMTQIIDDIWVDIEYSEYKIFDYFTSSSEILKDGYAICQFNAEIHNANPEQKKIFYNFMKQLLAEERYAFLKMTAYWGHWRMFFLDYKDTRCTEKYLLGY